MAEGPQLKAVTIKRGKDAPVGMCRGSAAAADGKCYLCRKMIMSYGCMAWKRMTGFHCVHAHTKTPP